MQYACTCHFGFHICRYVVSKWQQQDILQCVSHIRNYSVQYGIWRRHLARIQLTILESVISIYRRHETFLGGTFMHDRLTQNAYIKHTHTATYMRQWIRSTLVQMMAWRRLSYHTGLLSFGPFGTTFSEILTKKNFVCKMAVILSRWRCVNESLPAHASHICIDL